MIPITEYYDDGIFLTPEKFASVCPNEFKNVERIKNLGIRTALIIFMTYPEQNPILQNCELVFQCHLGSFLANVYLKDDYLIAIAGLGGSAAAGLMEELSVFGIKNFIAIGSAGCIDESVKDKFVVVDSAIRDEGASYKYLPPDIYVSTDNDLSTLLYDALLHFNCPAIRGTTWTTDAFYRETLNLIKKRREQGAVCVEMECASFSAVAKKKGLRFAQILYFSDVVNETEWKRTIDSEGHYNNNRDLMLELIIKVFEFMKSIND